MKREPRFRDLESMTKTGLFRAGMISLSFAQPLHPRAEFYKFKWWIFHPDSPCEGADFRKPENAISTAAAMALIQELSEKKKPHIIYNTQMPRLPKDGSPPLDVNSPRWKGYTWAPNLVDDTDPEWRGHK